jgi:hypothetical protein
MVAAVLVVKVVVVAVQGLLLRNTLDFILHN